ncbi:hypothetical protein FQA39_LY11336 [Lamprigera yunnana]|nr:hypothetical protein FQA39_LY11336 [Lamprigera yunnana]
MFYFKVLRNRILRYLETTSLHGLRYIGKSSTTFVEKIFWIFSFLLATVFAGLFIDIIIDNYNKSVIISLEPRPLSARDVPFPTVTICNLNRANRKTVDVLVNDSPLNNLFLNKLCNKHVDEEYSPVNFSKEQFVKFTLEVSPNCQEMIKICLWRNSEINCSTIFSPVITDIGACCVFNQLPLEYIFREKSDVKLKTKATFPSEDWNFEKGYEESSTNFTIPWRLKGRVIDLNLKKFHKCCFLGSGLTLVLDADTQNLYCPVSNSIGFKILTNNPVEMSLVRNYGIHIPPSYQSIINLMPTAGISESTLRHENYSSRWCYFNEERYLKFFRSYTLDNCLTECNVNYTIKRCNCIPYYIVDNSSAPMCHQTDEKCINDVLEFIANNEKPFGDRSECNCLPNCNEYNFDERMSYSRLTIPRIFNTFNITNEIRQSRTDQEFISSAAVVKIFYPKSIIETTTKNDLYDFVELFSNMGGILSMFLGFSFLSAFEVVYHLVRNILPVEMAAVRSMSRLLTQRSLSQVLRRGYAEEMSFTFAAGNQVFYNAQSVKQVDVPSFSGVFGILPKHVPTLAVLKPGIVTVFENDGAVKKIFVSSGTVTINEDSSVQVIAEEAADVNDLDVSAARDTLTKALSQMSSAGTDKEKAEAAIAVEVAEAIVKAAE